MEIHSTTILAIKHKGKIVIGGDGQVTFGEAVVKADARKIRRLADGKVVCGFAGASADAFALIERFEGMHKEYQGSLRKAAIELAKLWRTDKIYRQLQSMLIVATSDDMLLISGSGDVIEPSDGVLSIGSGGNYAAAAARALMRHSKLSAREIVEESMKIASEICVYTNSNISVEEP
jgi:ATP-dependent HslUV protease subunit HslV